MNSTEHKLCMKLLGERLKASGYLGSCDAENARNTVDLFDAGALKSVVALRFIGGSKDLSIDVLRGMRNGVLASISEFKRVATSVTTYYGVPEDSAMIFAEDMAVLVLGGDMSGWRHATTRDVFRHLYAAYRPRDYLIGDALHKKCADPSLVDSMLRHLYDGAFGW